MIALITSQTKLSFFPCIWEQGSTNPTINHKVVLLRYNKITLRELAEFREEVEGRLAAKAAEKVTEEDLKQLTEILDSIKSKLKDAELKWDEIIQEEPKFHRFGTTIVEKDR